LNSTSTRQNQAVPSHFKMGQRLQLRAVREDVRTLWRDRDPELLEVLEGIQKLEVKFGIRSEDGRMAVAWLRNTWCAIFFRRHFSRKQHVQSHQTRSHLPCFRTINLLSEFLVIDQNEFVEIAFRNPVVRRRHTDWNVLDSRVRDRLEILPYRQISPIRGREGPRVRNYWCVLFSKMCCVG
jgi:hypothetical protein